MSKEKLISRLENSMMTFMPVLYKKVYKDHHKVCGEGDITRHQMELMFLISMEGGKSMTNYGNKLMIPKSNLTVIADKLIKEGYIDRQFDPEDRRVIVLNLTEKGQQAIHEHMERHKQYMAGKLETLSEEDVQRLVDAIEEIQYLINKIEDKA